MQFTYTQQLLKGRDYSWVLTLIKMMVLVVCSIYIWNKILENQIRLTSLVSSLKVLSATSWIGLALVILLMPINWLLESTKWRFLIKPFSSMSGKDSLKSVLSGLAFGFVTPRSIGDYAGRMVFIDVSDRMKAILPTLLSRVSQLTPTLVGGVVGLVFLLKTTADIRIIAFWSTLLFVSVILIMILASIKWEQYLPGRKLIKLVRINYSIGDQLVVMGMSFLRYFIFTLQFIIVLMIMGMEVPMFLLFAGVSWIFLAKSILPSFNFLSDLGVREFSAILFFEAYGLPLEPVLISSIFIWSINILFPSILGVIVIGKSKFDLW